MSINNKKLETFTSVTGIDTDHDHSDLNMVLDEYANNFPEVAGDYEAYREAITNLTHELELSKDYFESPFRTLMLFGVAGRRVNAEKSSEEERLREREFSLDVMAIVANGYANSDAMLAARQLVEDSEQGYNEDTVAKAFDRYTDKKLTAELKQLIENGLLDDVKQRLGITADNEDDYDLRVVSAAVPQGMVNSGLRFVSAQHTDTYKDASIKDRTILDQEATEATASLQHWHDGLLQRGVEFAGEMGLDTLPSEAWLTVIKGRQTLVVTSPIAETIINTSLRESNLRHLSTYLPTALASLEHEYTHAQGGVNQGSGSSIGLQ